MLKLAPASILTWITATMMNDAAEMNMPYDIRRNGVASRPNKGYNQSVMMGTRIMTRIGLAESISSGPRR